MTQANAPLVSFSGGIIGKQLQNRVDVDQYPKAAEIMTNFRPDPQGTMTRRPALEYIDSFTDHAKKGYQFPFVYDTAQSYLVLATSDGFDFLIDDGRVTTDSVTATIADGGFAITYNDYADVATLTASSTAVGSIANIDDEDSSTYWQSSAATPAYVDFDLLTSITIYDMWLSCRNSTGTGAPTAFTVKGSATGAFAGEETTVLTVSGGAAWAANEKRKYRITTPGAYRYYRLNMTATAAGSGSYVLSEVSLWHSPWLDNSTGTGSVNITGGTCYLDSDGSVAAIVEQKITINQTTSSHTLIFTVTHGPVSMQLGTTSGGYDLLDYADLGTGTHYLSFTPNAATVYLQFYQDANAGRTIDNVSILSGTQFRLPHPYTQAQLPNIKWEQIGDRMWLAHADVQTRVLERRGHRSWSLVKFLPNDGPFDTLNITSTSISSSATTGEVTMTASDDVFVSSDAGNLLSLTYAGQLKAATAGAADVFTDAIKVTGGKDSRTFRLTISGTFSATVTLQESSGNENNFTDNRTYTAPTDINFFDNRENQTWFYRLAVKAGNYTSGTVSMQLEFAGGSSTGTVRIITVNSATSVTAEVLEALAYTGAVKTWKKGAWNSVKGWPAAISGGFGRLWLGRGIELWGSVSDDFFSFEEGEKDDLLVSRKLTSASSKGIRWMAFLNYLCIGTQTAEQLGLGNTESEPVSNSNFKTLPGSMEGVADLQPVRAGDAIVYVHRNQRQVEMFTQNPQAISATNWISVDLTELAPRLLDEKILKIAVQQEPNRRIFVVLKSGKCLELLFRPEIQIRAWSEIETDGRIEDVQVISQDDEDKVYFVVRRKVNGTWKRFIEKLNREEVDNDEDFYHLDSALRLDLTRPDTPLIVSAKTGTVTVTSDDSAFSAGDVGKIFWVRGGKGTIATYVSATVITVTLTTDVDGVEDDDDAFVAAPGWWGFGANVTGLTGLDHLEGDTVTVHGDMQNLGSYTVASGAITLTQSCSIAFAGKPMRSRYKSLKLSYGGQKGTALAQPKAIKALAIILYRTGAALKFGPRFNKLRPLPTRTATTPWNEPVKLFTGEKEKAFDADWNTDSRLCFECDDPSPATISGIVPQIETRDR